MIDRELNPQAEGPWNKLTRIDIKMNFPGVGGSRPPGSLDLSLKENSRRNWHRFLFYRDTPPHDALFGSARKQNPVSSCIRTELCFSLQSLGLLTATLAKSQQQAYHIGALIFWPMWFAGTRSYAFTKNVLSCPGYGHDMGTGVGVCTAPLFWL